MHRLRIQSLVKAEEILNDKNHPFFKRAQSIKSGLLGLKVLRKHKKKEKAEKSKILRPYRVIKLQLKLDKLNLELTKYDRDSVAFKVLDTKRLKVIKKLDDHIPDIGE